MIRSVVVIACFTYGFVYALIDHALRVVIWLSAIALLAAGVGLNPYLAIFLCFIAGALGRALYRDE